MKNLLWKTLAIGGLIYFVGKYGLRKFMLTIIVLATLGNLVSNNQNWGGVGIWLIMYIIYSIIKYKNK